jgi:hypothetical protein
MRAESPERLAPSDVRSPFTGRFGSAVCPVPALGGCSAHASLNLRTPKHRRRRQVRVGVHKLGAVTFKTVEHAPPLQRRREEALRHHLALRQSVRHRSDGLGGEREGCAREDRAVSWPTQKRECDASAGMLRKQLAPRASHQKSGHVWWQFCDRGEVGGGRVLDDELSASKHSGRAGDAKRTMSQSEVPTETMPTLARQPALRSDGQARSVSLRRQKKPAQHKSNAPRSRALPYTNDFVDRA